MAAGSAIVDPSGRIDQPAEFRIMKYEGRAVGAGPQVALDAVSPCRWRR